MLQRDDIVRVASEVWQRVYDLKSERTGPTPERRTFETNAYRNTFEEIALYCLQRGYDHYTYLDFVVQELTSGNYLAGSWKPTVFGKRIMFDKYEQYHRTAVECDPAFEWQRQTSLLVSTVKRLSGRVAAYSLEDILMMPDMSFTAWFRICAIKNPPDYALRAYGNAAQIEMKEDRGLVAFLREKAPAALQAIMEFK